MKNNAFENRDVYLRTCTCPLGNVIQVAIVEIESK